MYYTQADFYIPFLVLHVTILYYFSKKIVKSLTF